MREVIAEDYSLLNLGKVGENNATRISFDVKDWVEEFGNGTFTLVNKRYGESSAYPVLVERVGNIVYWTVKNSDTQYAGDGSAQLILTINGVVAKSFIYKTYVYDSLDGSATPPAPWQSWVDEVIEAKEDAETARDEAEESAEEAEESAQSVLGLTANASVTNTTGIPSVTVTVTEVGGNKHMDFAFTNIKGERGGEGAGGVDKDTGSTVSFFIGVDANGVYFNY